MHNIGRVLYKNYGIWCTSVYLVDLDMLATWATLLNCLERVNQTNLVTLAKWIALCLKVPVGHALQLTKGRYTLRSVVYGITECK